MGQYFSRHYDHLIIATKKRRPLLSEKIRKGLRKVIDETLKNRKCSAIAVNGTEDHIHILMEIHRSESLAGVARNLKSFTAKWIRHELDNDIEFQWQSGWAAFSVSHSNLKSVADFINKQSEVHKKMSFKEEMKSFLVKHEIPFDERYLY